MDVLQRENRRAGRKKADISLKLTPGGLTAKRYVLITIFGDLEFTSVCV